MRRFGWTQAEQVLVGDLSSVAFGRNQCDAGQGRTAVGDDAAV